jgi:hypothetical protein
MKVCANDAIEKQLKEARNSIVFFINKYGFDDKIQC